MLAIRHPWPSHPAAAAAASQHNSGPIGGSARKWLALSLLLGSAPFFATLATAAVAQEPSTDLPRVVTPNFRQAEQYSSAYLRQFVYSTSVTPNWIDKTDEFWYSYKTSEGTRYWRVHPEKGTRLPLFDPVKLAAQLSQLTRQPVEPGQLNLTRLEVNGAEDTLKFVIERTQYEYSLKSETLKELGPAPAQANATTAGRGGRQQQEQQQEQRRNTGRESQSAESNGESPANEAHRNFAPDRKSYVFAKGHNLYFVQIPDAPAEETPAEKPSAPLTEGQTDKQGDGSPAATGAVSASLIELLTATKLPVQDEQKQDEQKQDEQKQDEQKQDEQKQDEQKQDEQKQDEQKQDEQKQDEQKQDEQKQDEQKQDEQKQDEQKQDEQKQDEQKQDEQKQDEQKQDEQKQDEQKQDEQKQDEQKQDEQKQDEQKQEEAAEEPEKFDPKWDELAIQITTDGEADYSFAGRTARRGASTEIKEDTLTRPNVTWSKDSRSFYITRSDTRGVKELWVINSLSSPRPTLETYGYPMPGEENVRRSELHWYRAGHPQLTPVEKRWKDEFYSDVRFTESQEQLRFLRRDRVLRNVQYVSVELANGEVKGLFEEGFEKATIAPKAIRFLENNQEMIWWSERSGWGHFYLYDIEGNLKNAITAGTFFADRIVDLDEENRTLYFTAMGREPGENLNNRHLYSVRLDGQNLKLLDPGNADHSSSLSPTKRYVIDNHSRVDMAPRSVVRNSDGVEIMALEECDLSRLQQVGWKMPETFVVKAADGVTDLFGNMYKPFNFDPNKKYPIITYVYPGPQQEGTRHTFTATAGEQQLAQIGFIVIQVGHRGGTPGRSKAYASYGYFNLRDYALADKKSAIEQLAQRFPFIDVERVGMYGHSGGGFMTAAALMSPPYNDFFKAGFSTAGNHDNNIYNNSWSERWHGLKEVPVEQAANNTRGGSGSRGQQRSAPSDLQAVLQVDPEDFFYDYEMTLDEDPWQFEQRLWGDHEPMPLWLQEEVQEQERQQQQQQQTGERQDGQQRDTRGGQRGGRSRQRQRQEQQNRELQDEKQQDDKQQDDKQQDEKQQDEKSKTEQKTRFEIAVPTNAELAANLKHHLFLVHGELDNNVHPANTLRLVDALIKANKKFDMLYLPGTRHGFGSYQPYVTQRMFEFFAARLLTDYQE